MIRRFFDPLVFGRQARGMSGNRRKHRLFSTSNTEYHLRTDECVGVRDRQSGRWLRGHVALRLRALRLPPPGSDHHWIGRRIHFWGATADVLTSPVVDVARPNPGSLESYVSLAMAGEISE